MKYKCVKQYDETDCAAACISTICMHYGYKKNITSIREIAGTDKNGTNGNGVIKALTELGFESEGVILDDKNIFCEDIRLPCIAHVNKQDCNHYVVLYFISKDKIIVADPADGVVNYSVDDFMQIWSGILFLISPTDKLEELSEDKCHISLVKLVCQEKGFVLGILLCSIIYTAIGVLSTLFFQIVFDEMIPNNTIKSLQTVAFGLCLVYAIGGFMQFLRIKMMLILGKKFDMELTYNT